MYNIDVPRIKGDPEKAVMATFLGPGMTNCFSFMCFYACHKPTIQLLGPLVPSFP